MIAGLNEKQRIAVDYPGNVVITACPGSGKTRVLTARLLRALTELTSKRQRAVALTFTNRAADEIQNRLDQTDIDTSCLWAGTIHSFALEWILRPYAPYSEELRYCFSVASEYLTERLISQLKSEAKMGLFDAVSTHLTRKGEQLNETQQARAVFIAYKKQLREQQLIDYDDVLFLAYKLLKDVPEIAATLASIFRVICVDEVQDIQDLQYGILSTIFHMSPSTTTLFFVGDENQSIYESLGAMTKTPHEIATEFGLDTIKHLDLSGNYRSTQRIINLYSRLRPSVGFVESLAHYANEAGHVTFENQSITNHDLAPAIAKRISTCIADGIPTHEICVLAPQWELVQSIARRLVNELPGVDFDAPGLSPLHSSRENFWFKVARLVLTRPSPQKTRTRMRWAKEAIADLHAITRIAIPDSISTPRRLLRLLNSLSSQEAEGLAYLRDVFKKFLLHIQLDIEDSLALKEAYEGFFGKAEKQLSGNSQGLASDIESFRRLFSHPAGVVVSTCHAVKGEEYEAVIAFGLLRGYIPHWNVVMTNDRALALESESKLLYVICSRAKRRLHLISEHGRRTRKSNALYETCTLLSSLQFEFDQ